MARSGGRTKTGAFMLSINWRRGLMRLWIAASIVWLVAAGAVLQKDIRQDVSTLQRDASWLMEAEIAQSKTLPMSPSDEEAPKLRPLRPSDFPLKSTSLAQDRLMLSAIVVFLPPILAFALGRAGLWIMSGFRSKED